MNKARLLGSSLLVGLLYLPALGAETLQFTLLHTNDEHASLLDPEGSADFAHLAGAVKSVRAQRRREGISTLLLSAGDYMGGTAFSWLSLEGQAPELNLMRNIGYDAVTIGNHEFDYGPEVLADYLAAAGYPAANRETALLASNTDIPADHPLAHRGIRATRVLELANGLRVGLFGVLGEAAQAVTTAEDPVLFSNSVEAARRAARDLNEADADVILALTHSGLEEDRALARAVPEIDLIVGGHSHTPLHRPETEAGVPIVQTGARLEHLGVLDLRYEQDNGTLEVLESDTPYLLDLDGSVTPDAAIAEQVQQHLADMNDLVAQLTQGLIQDSTRPLARLNFPVERQPPFAEIPLGNYITDAMRYMGEAVTGEPVDFAFQANGLIRDSLRPAHQEGVEGTVSFLDLAAATGLGTGPDGRAGYPLISAYLTGREVRRMGEMSQLLSQLEGNDYFLQVSGLRMRYDPDRALFLTVPFLDLPIPSGRALLQIERETDDGYAPLDDDRLYHVISDYYLVGFLPQIGKTLPSLEVVPKNASGEPLTLEDTILHRDGREIKTWQAVTRYTMSHPAGADGLPAIPQRYREPQGRLQQNNTLPWMFYPAMGLILLTLLVGSFVYYRRLR